MSPEFSIQPVIYLYTNKIRENLTQILKEKQTLYRKKFIASGNLSVFILEILIFFQKPIQRFICLLNILKLVLYRKGEDKELETLSPKPGHVPCPGIE